MVPNNRNRADYPLLRRHAVVQRRRKRRALGWAVIVAAMFALPLAFFGPIAFAHLLDLIPDRYIAAYAPEPIREAVFAVDPYQIVPTAAADQAAADQLLASLSSTPTPTPTLTPVVPLPGGGSGDSYVQPTPLPVAPTPTVTPARIPEAASRAEEGGDDANLSHASHLLTGFTHTYQGWNNCGPSTIVTALSYWRVETTQAEAAAFTKPNPEDRNVRPDELTAFVESVSDYRAIVRINGNIELLKTLILAGYPVVIERGFDPEPDRLGWMGHYLVLIGFSDEDREFIAMDSYLGPNRALPYDELDHFWRHFNRIYIVIYRPDQELAIASIIGENMDDATMYNNALLTAQAELMLDSNDPFGWFNLGGSLVGLGRYDEAAVAYDRAREIGLPWRILWYQFGPYEAYIHARRYGDVISLAEAVIAQNPQSEEAYYYMGLAYQGRGDNAEAEQNFNRAIYLNSHYTAAREALDALHAATGGS
jgi:tetratricopeptide (TPR) repeat protein